jgi:hypothetical protein
MYFVKRKNNWLERQLLFGNLNSYDSMSLSLSLSNKLDETTKSEEQNCAKRAIFLLFFSMCVSAKVFLSF